MSDDVTCATCARSGPEPVDAWHNFMHSFRAVGEPSSLKDFKPSGEVQPRATVGPFDPVLRQALIDKGVLTPEDLRAAEEKIAAVTGAFQASFRRIADKWCTMGTTHDPHTWNRYEDRSTVYACPGSTQGSERDQASFYRAMGPDTIVSSGPANRGGVDE